MAAPDRPGSSNIGDPLALARTFLAAYEEGSTGAAARILGVSQSTVSRQISTLERNVGHALFERGRDGMRPTAAGERLAEQLSGPVKAVMRALPEARNELQPIRVGSSADLLAAVVIPAVAGLIGGGTKLTMEVGLPEVLARRARLGALDVLVLPKIPSGLARQFRMELLLEEQFHLVAGPQWSEGLPFDEKERLAHVKRAIPFLALASPPPFARRWWRRAAGTAPPAPALILPDARALATAAVLGAGAVVLPRFLTDESLQRGLLVDLAPQVAPVTNEIHVAYRIGGRSTDVETVVTALLDHHSV